MDGGDVEVWVVNMDRELREREAANGEEGKEERGSVSSPGALDGPRPQSHCSHRQTIATCHGESYAQNAEHETRQLKNTVTAVA